MDISLEIITPEAVIMQEMVEMVSLPGSAGRFAVLKNHAPLISSLEEGKILYRNNEGEGFVEIKSGFVKVCDNQVCVCAEL